MVKIKTGRKRKENQTLTLIQVYAPTAMTDDREIEEFSEKLGIVTEEQRINEKRRTMIIRDFNSHVEKIQAAVCNHSKI